MGIIKAGIDSLAGAASEQWKEFFLCGEMGSEILISRAVRQGGANSANQGSFDIITEGSVIVIGEGEAAIVTENGKIIGAYDEPGEQVFQTEQGRGFFTGGIRSFAKDVGRRITFGGEAAYSHRLYYINTKEIMGNPFLAESIPFRYKDENTGLDMDGAVSCAGSYSFKITDFVKFYKAIIHKEAEKMRRDLTRQMNVELLTVLSTLLGEISQKGVRPNEVPAYVEELANQLTEAVNEKWSALRGITVHSMAIESVTVLDAAMIQELQIDAALKDPSMAAAHLTGAISESLKRAANNTSPGTSALIAAMTPKQSLFNSSKRVMPETAQGEQNLWRCVCGKMNKGKFCEECGKPRM